MNALRSYSSLLRPLYWRSLGKTVKFIARVGTRTGCLLSAQLVTQPSKPKVYLPEDLTTKKIIQNASSVASESAITLHHQTALAMMEAELLYQEAIGQLVACLQYLIKNNGGGQLSDDLLWEKIIGARHRVNECRKNKVELEYLFENTEKLVALSAEISYSSGSEYSAVTANERLLSVRTQLGVLRRTTEEAETKLARTETQVIEVSGKEAVS